MWSLSEQILNEWWWLAKKDKILSFLKKNIGIFCFYEKGWNFWSLTNKIKDFNFYSLF